MLWLLLILQICYYQCPTPASVFTSVSANVQVAAHWVSFVVCLLNAWCNVALICEASINISATHTAVMSEPTLSVFLYCLSSGDILVKSMDLQRYCSV